GDDIGQQIRSRLGDRRSAAHRAKRVDHQIHRRAAFADHVAAGSDAGDDERQAGETNDVTHALPQPLMIRGVMKTSSSVFWSFTDSRLNSHLSSGICPRPAVFSLSACSWLTKMPPITVV